MIDEGRRTEDGWLVTNRIEGNFPGGQVDLRHASSSMVIRHAVDKSSDDIRTLRDVAVQEEELDELIGAFDEVIASLEETTEDPAAATKLLDPSFFAAIDAAEEPLGICAGE